MDPETERDERASGVQRLVAEVMKVERKYGHALRGASSDRLEEIRDAIEAASGGPK